MDMDAHNSQHPLHSSRNSSMAWWHGWSTGRQRWDAPCFPSWPPPFPPLPPIFLFSLASRCTRHTTLVPLPSPPHFFSLPGFPPILLQRVPLHHCGPHHSPTWCAAPPALPLSFFPLPTHQQAALGCEASCTWIAGMLAAAPEEDPVTKEHTTPSSTTSPLPRVCEDMTLKLLCTAITNHHCSAHSPAGIEDTASASHHDDGHRSSAF